MSLFTAPGRGITPAVVALDGHVRAGLSSRRGSKLLTVEREVLTLRCLRTYRFTPEEVVAIEPDGPSWCGSGVRVLHNRANYPRSIHFHCSGGAETVAMSLERVGFVPCGSGAGWQDGLVVGHATGARARSPVCRSGTGVTAASTCRPRSKAPAW